MSPNSVQETCLLSIFKAGDSTMNLHTPPGIYRVHIKEVQGMPCKYEVIKISDTKFFFFMFQRLYNSHFYLAITSSCVVCMG